jgi:hypothetical protein
MEERCGRGRDKRRVKERLDRGGEREGKGERDGKGEREIEREGKREIEREGGREIESEGRIESERKRERARLCLCSDDRGSLPIMLHPRHLTQVETPFAASARSNKQQAMLRLL